MPKTILDKLGFKPGMVAWAIGRPDGLKLDIPSRPPEGAPDLILAFVMSKADVPGAIDAALPRYERGKALWFAYPKKSGAIRTDISRDDGWQALIERDVHPVMQVAIDDTWSALRFRHRDEIKSFTRKGF